MNPIRHSLTEAAVLGDSLVWKLRGQGLFAAGSGPATGPAWAMPDWATGLKLPRWTPRNRTAQRFGGKLRIGRSAVLWGSGLAALATGTAALAVYSRTETAQLMQLRQRLGMIAVHSADGVALGGLPRADRLIGRDGSNNKVVRIAAPVTVLPQDFLRAGKAIEGEGVLGISPHNLLRSAVCYGAAGAGLQKSGLLRLANGKCAGASTLLAQSVRSLTDDRRVSIGRKAGELFSTISLAANLSDADQDRLIADTLYFGDAEGQPIFGVENAARAVFGKAAAELELHESAYLSALLLIPARLSCEGTATSTTRFTDQVGRAKIALTKAFASDPRLAGALTRLAALAPIVAPVSDPLALAAGRTPGEACRAGANPLQRFEVLDSSARLAARAELAANPAAGQTGKIVLSYNWAEQAQFKSAIGRAQAEIATRQRGLWLSDPQGAGVVTLAFATAPNGGLTALHESSAEAQLHRPHELGSLAKLPALAFLAGRGWGDRPFCNRQASFGSKQLHNAGGDKGVADCATGTGLGADEVWARSLSLAVYDALRGYADAELRAQMAAWRIDLPAQSGAAYALAFGLARATPADFAAFVAALSAGNTGQPALGYRPHVLQASGREAPAIDLGAVFSAPGAAALIARAGGAAQSWRRPRAAGTLAALGPAALGTIVKSGTLDDEAGQVRYKAAAGGLGGATWTVMVFPANGALGGDGISIIPLAKVVSQQASSRNGR